MELSSATARKAVQPFIARMGEESSAKVVADQLSGAPVRLDQQDVIEYDDGAMWSDDIVRRLSRKTHGWFFLRYWYSAWPILDESTREKLMERLGDLLATWMGYRTAGEGLAFHDEGTAQRVINFVVLLDTVEPYLPNELSVTIRELIAEETRLLASDDFYAGSNNHGMFQDLAVLVSTAYGHCREDAEALDDHVINRLLAYLHSCFTTDGIHTENNPSYHMMVSRYLTLVVNYCKAVGYTAVPETLQRIVADADRYAAFAFTPQGHYVPVSDTKRGPISVSSVKAAFGNGLAVGALTNGKRGTLPEDKVFVAEDSGYGIYRSDWTPEANYVFFSSAYNADYHKHSDEGSLYYYAHGRELLVEAGPNGYQYSDPFTKYAFSSAAHNSMLVDGVGLARVDGNAELTTLADLGSSTTALAVEGRTRRYTGVDWRREVHVPAENNGELVRVTDSVVADSERTFTFLWHLGEGLTAFARGNAIEIFDEQTDEKYAELVFEGAPVTSVVTSRGRQHPYHQGWSFPKMGESVPVDVVEVEVRGTDITMNWEIRSTDFRLVDRGVTPQSAWLTHEAEKPVHYLIEGVKPDGTADSLVIAFTAMGELQDFTYNYKTTLDDFAGTKLFILDDFGDQGAYYLANGRNLAEFRSVQSLIRSVVDQLGVPLSKVTTLGSSKGATAALLHGTAAGVGQVFSGAPQFRIGDFVREPHPNVLQYVSGGTKQGDVDWLNEVPRKLLASGVRSTKVTVIVGRADHHYRHHVIPLVDELRKLGYSVENLQVPGTPHSAFSLVFRNFVSSFVKTQNPGSPVQFPNGLAYDSESKNLGLVVSGLGDDFAQVQLFRGSEKVGKLQRIVDGMVDWQGIEAGDYRARIYYDNSDGERKAFPSVACKAREI